MSDKDCASFGAFGKVLVQGGDEPRTFDDSSERLGLISESIRLVSPLQGRRVITGNLCQHANAIRKHSSLISGALVTQVGPEQLHLWLPRAMWPDAITTASGADTYLLGNDGCDYTFDMLIDRDGEIFRYNNVRVARLVLRSRSENGQQPTNEELLEMVLYFYAEEEIRENVDPVAAAWPNPEPTLGLLDEYQPYAHWEGKMFLGGKEGSGDETEVCFDNLQLSIDNRLVPIFYNSLTPKCFRSAGRVIQLGFTSPFLSDSIDIAAAAQDEELTDSELVFTHEGGNMVTRFCFPYLKNEYRTPSIRGKGEIPLEFNFLALCTDSQGMLEVVNDHTP